MEAIDYQRRAAVLARRWASANPFRSASLQGLPGLSFVIADQIYSPNLVSNGTVSDVGQGNLAVGDNNALGISSLVHDAKPEGVTVEAQDQISEVDLNPLQALAYE